MATTKEQRKAKAIEIMKQLDIYKDFIKGYEQNDYVCMYEHYIGFWTFQYPKLESKIKEVENKYDCTVYAVTHEYTDFGELYDLLIVPKYKGDWKYLIHSNKNEHTVYAYVWNKTDEICSEFGDIAVQSACGGIRRIA